jgi:uncharacterized protein
MVIDVFCHYISKPIDKLLEKSKYYGNIPPGKQYPYPIQNADPEVRLGLMEKYGVDMQAISQTTPVLMGFNASDAAEICRVSNNDNYALCKAYPKKFVNIGMISLFDVKSALKELDRCVADLDCRGVTISSNQNGKGLDSPEYFPFYEKIVKYDLPILIHPIHWESYPLTDNVEAWRLMHIFGWPFDSSQAAWRLVMSGAIDRFPELKIVLHHMGGMLPYFERRMQSSFDRFWKDKMPRPLTEYWGNFYGDTAVDGTIPAYSCGYGFFGPDRLMYGSDYPFGTEAGELYIRNNLSGVRTLQVSKRNMDKILGGNAKKLLKIK